jgi:sodium/bile acid cotransporter 7
LKLDPLPLWLALVVALATVLPARGILAMALPGLTNGAVVLLLFLHGLRLSRAAMLAGLTHWRLHLLVAGLTFLAFPLIVLVLRWAMPAALPGPLWGGLLFLSAAPSTVQSSIAFTALAGGNVAAAVCAATLSNLGGVLVTPWLATALLGSGPGGIEGGVTGDQVFRVVGLILLPTLAGQLARPWAGGWADARSGLLKAVDRASILFIVYAAFSAAVVAGLWELVPPEALAALLGVNVLVFSLAAALAWRLSAGSAFTPADRRTILFVGTTKSLATGAPIAGVLLPPALVGATILPLMLYHPLQSLVCSALAARWATRAAR